MKSVLSLILAVLLLPVFLAAQQQPVPTETKKAADQDIGKDDILILVNIKADSLRFEAVPNTTVEFPGKHERTSVWTTDRQNLPEKIEPGVTYRNIGLQLRISTRFADIERIVREALGEIPKTTTLNADPILDVVPKKPEVAQSSPAKPPTRRSPRRR
jgi:hypothetical protein